MATLISLYQICSHWIIGLTVLAMPAVVRRWPDAPEVRHLCAPRSGPAGLLVRLLGLEHLFWFYLWLGTDLIIWLASLALALYGTGGLGRGIAATLAIAAVALLSAAALRPAANLKVPGLICLTASLLANVALAPASMTATAAPGLLASALVLIFIGFYLKESMRSEFDESPPLPRLAQLADLLMLGGALSLFLLGLFQLLSLSFSA